MIPLVLALCLAADGPAVLTRQQARARALALSPELSAAASGVDIAAAGVRSAGAWPNPTLGISYGTDEPQLFGTVDQRLPLFGQRGSSIDAARAEVAVAEGELAVRKLAVEVALDRAYTALAAAQQQRALAEQAAQLAKELAQKTKAKVEARLAAELELDQAKLAAARAEQDVSDRRAGEAAALAQLAALLGLGPEAQLRAGDPLWPLPQAPAEASAPHPELVVAERAQAAALDRAARERAAVRPVPELSVEVQDHPTPEQPVGVRGGLAFEVPLFSQNGGNIDAQMAQAAQAQAQRKATALRLQAQKRASLARWQAARSRAEFAVNQDVPGSSRVRDLARTAYELGRIPFTSLLGAEADLNRARAAAVDATAAAWDARDDLAAANGALP